MRAYPSLVLLSLQGLAAVTSALPVSNSARFHGSSQLNVEARAGLVDAVGLGQGGLALLHVARAGKGGAGNAGGGSAASAKDVQAAANAFAKDVGIVSSSLNGIGSTTDTAQIKKLAKAGFDAESDEDQRRAVLNGAATGTTAKQANAKIVQNTPTVLNGLKSIQQNPSPANVMKQLSTMEKARNANILPSITALSNSAFQATGVNAQAKTFAPTQGVKNLSQLQAGGGGGNKAAATSTKGNKNSDNN